MIGGSNLKAWIQSAGALGFSLVVVVACDDPGDPATPTTSSSSSSSSSSSTSSSGDSGTTPVPGATTGLAADCANGDEGPPAPTTSGAALNEWLQKRSYQCWARESQVHASTGPHGGNVRVYLNKTLATSLAAAPSGENAEGSISVKEFFSGGKEAVTGWAVGVKTQATSANGQGWYWYEVFSATPNASGSAGQGTSLCSNCHRGGTDYVLIPFPLR